MHTFILRCITRFGFLSGIATYLRIKIFNSTRFYLPGFVNPIYYRPGTADISTFREIFLREEYNLGLPPDFPVATIIDAGSNIGFTALFFLQKFPGAKIISLEPDAENFALLQKNVSPYQPITPLQKALWRQSGFIKVTDQGYGVRGFVVEDAEVGTPDTIPAVSLNDLVRDYALTSIDILKMDIEGSEKEVFEGDTSWLSITRCLVIELHDRMKPGCSKAVFSKLAEHNFECSIRGENLVFINQNRLT